MKQNTDSNYNFCLVGAATDPGKVRKANEDSMAVFEAANMKVFVVCDGMGGHVGGQVASQTAIAAIRDFLVNNITLDPREAIHKAMVTANEAILNRTHQQPELAGMGSTCVMLTVTSDGKVYYGHVGDSRIYIVANHRITPLTKDHSYVQTLVDAGQITQEQAEHHPRKNEIINALGFATMQAPTVCQIPIEPASGNCFLLCSDGLSGMVSEEQIKRVVSKHDIPIQQRAEKLVQMANDNGGVDNITVQLVEFAIGAQDINSPPKKNNQWKTLLYILPVVLLLAGGVAWWVLYKQHKNDERTITELPLNSSKMEDIVRGLSPITRITNQVAFSKIDDPPFVVGISDFETNDSIFNNTINVVNSEVDVTGIDGRYLTIKWLKKPAGEAILIHCETKLYKDFTIKIPLSKTVKTNEKPLQTDDNSKDASSKEHKLSTITFKFNDDENDVIRVPVTDDIKWLSPGIKTTNNPELVECNVKNIDKSKKKWIEIKFKTPDYPDKEVIFHERHPLLGNTHQFIISVEKPEKVAGQPVENEAKVDTIQDHK